MMENLYAVEKQQQLLKNRTENNSLMSAVKYVADEMRHSKRHTAKRK